MPLPPGHVVGHDRVAVAHGGPELPGVLEVEGVAPGGLVEGGGVLDRPVVRLPVGARRLSPQQVQRLAGAGRPPPAFGERRVQVPLDVGACLGGGPQTPVELRETGQEARMRARHVVRDLVVQLGTGPGEVVSHEADRIVRVVPVVGAHPFHEPQVVGVVPPQEVALELLAHDAPRVALAVQHVVVEAQAGAPGGLQREGAKTPLLDEVAEDAVLEGEEVVRAVGGLAQTDHPGAADHPFQSPQITAVAARFDGPQGVGGAVERVDDRGGGGRGRRGRDAGRQGGEDDEQGQ